MTETMVNGMKFRVWNDTTRKATFAESEDGRWWGWNVVTLKSMLKKAGYSYET